MKEHIKSLDGIRGLAAMLILGAHILDTIFQGTSVFKKTNQIALLLAYSGMSLFFVLSGTVMQINYGKNPEQKWSAWNSFIIKRVARLLPLYFLCLICYNGLSLLFIKPLVGITYFTLTQTWVNNMLFVFAPAWSISTEFYFYFAFILITITTLKIKSYIKIKPKFCITTLFILMSIAHFFLFTKMETIVSTLSFLKRSSNENLGLYLSYYAPYTRILEFIIGIAIGKILQQSDILKAGKTDIIFGILITLVMLSCYFLKTGFGSYIIQNFALAPTWGLLILLSVNQKDVKSIFEQKIFVETGKISYGIYLLQFFVLTTLVILIPGSDFVSKISKVLGIISLTYFLAYGSSVLFEQPMRTCLRKLCN